MSAVNDFVSELVRAANEVEKLGSFERRRLLDRAVTTIRDMREKASIPSSKTRADALVGIQITSALVETGNASADQVRESLLEAAGMIRELHIVLDKGTEISLDGGTTH